MTDLENEPNEAHQLDFWLGEWDVTWEEGQYGSNKVERILDGKVIQETFDANPSMPFRGTSLSVFNPRIGIWQQTWVDTSGNYWHFTGEFKDGQMEFGTEDTVDGRLVSLRMVFYNISRDELDWNWERSDDGGRTWELRWKLHYRRKSG